MQQIQPNKQKPQIHTEKTNQKKNPYTKFNLLLLSLAFLSNGGRSLQV